MDLFVSRDFLAIVMFGCWGGDQSPKGDRSSCESWFLGDRFNNQFSKSDRILKRITNNFSELNIEVEDFCLLNLGWKPVTLKDFAIEHKTFRLTRR